MGDGDVFSVDLAELVAVVSALATAAEESKVVHRHLQTAARLVIESEMNRSAGHQAQHFSNRSCEEFELRFSATEEVAGEVLQSAQAWLLSDAELAAETG